METGGPQGPPVFVFGALPRVSDVLVADHLNRESARHRHGPQGRVVTEAARDQHDAAVVARQFRARSKNPQLHARAIAEG
jgi:hypothetical protein